MKSKVHESYVFHITFTIKESSLSNSDAWLIQ